MNVDCTCCLLAIVNVLWQFTVTVTCCREVCIQLFIGTNTKAHTESAF